MEPTSLDGERPDVLVCGASFAGLAVARELAGSGADMVLVDRTSPWGNGYMLPRGTLREPPAHIKRASYIFLTKCDGTDNSAILKELRRITSRHIGPHDMPKRESVVVDQKTQMKDDGDIPPGSQ